MAKIIKTKSGNYQTYVFIGRDENGKRIRKSITHPDRNVVRQMAFEYEKKYKGATSFSSFEDCAEQYIAQKEAVLSPSTVRGYKSMLRCLKSDFSEFCETTAMDIDKRMLQDVVSRMSKDGDSPKYIRNLHGFISAVLTFHDVEVPKVKLPVPLPPTLYEPTIADIKELLKAVKGTELEIPVHLGIRGLREGEVCGLQYPDDFGKDYVYVRRSMVQKPDRTYTYKMPKNKKSIRYVPVDKELIAQVKKQGCVTNLNTDQLSQTFGRFIKKNKLPPIRFHDLRHFFAAYMHHKGFDESFVLDAGGWSTGTIMKKVYRHTLEDGKKKKKMNEIFSDLT